MPNFKDVKVDFHAPLNPEDTESQTKGCRANNPDICFNQLNPCCAFVREDGICTHPSRKWKAQYEHLKELQKEKK